MRKNTFTTCIQTPNWTVPYTSNQHTNQLYFSEQKRGRDLEVGISQSEEALQMGERPPDSPRPEQAVAEAP